MQEFRRAGRGWVASGVTEIASRLAGVVRDPHFHTRCSPPFQRSQYGLGRSAGQTKVIDRKMKRRTRGADKIRGHGRDCRGRLCALFEKSDVDAHSCTFPAHAVVIERSAE